MEYFWFSGAVNNRYLNQDVFIRLFSVFNKNISILIGIEDSCIC